MKKVSVENIKDVLKELLKKSLKASFENKELPEILEIPEVLIEVPANKLNGDFSSNIAMMCAKKFKMPPRDIAKIILKNLKIDGLFIEKCEIAGAGFINFFLNDNFYNEVLLNILSKKENYGKNNMVLGKRVLVEYVSANPTGPMHMGNARGGAFGDCLASLLEIAGYDVTREFYVNDAGNQIAKFALSLDIRYRQIISGSEENPQLPEDCYQGEDIKDLSREFYNLHEEKYLNCSGEERQKALVEFALPKNIQKMHYDLKRYNINFDNWFSEKSLYKSGEVEKTIENFKKKSLTYERDDALWFKATDFGAEKDEVLVRNNGIPTYFLVDVAYHINKFLKRNYDLCIDLLGADHAGHVNRMKLALKALGVDSEKLKIIIFQLVRLVKDGKVVKMSKRTGKAINLSDLLDEVPTDAIRFIFNMKDANSQMDFDLSLAVEKNMDNPVYYVQYAYARICSVFKMLEKSGENLEFSKINLTKNIFKKEEEKDLIKLLHFYPEEIALAVKEYNPSRIMKYVLSVASTFHKFYNSCKINCENKELMEARFTLCYCTKTVIKNVLNMFKISAPESM